MSDILSLLPGYNCGSCGFRQCRDFAAQLKSPEDLRRCPFLERDIFRDNLGKLSALVGADISPEEKITGIIDGLEADFMLAPLRDECSCREFIHPFNGAIEINTGDLLRYRPLGCPITHFAKVIDIDPGIYTIHLVGPLHRLGREDLKFKDIGLCMILAFEGRVSRGKLPKVGQTVKFVPEYCMMQKVHSGMVVSVEGRDIRIEGIDLKVW